jgi:hypothetical protein
MRWLKAGVGEAIVHDLRPVLRPPTGGLGTLGHHHLG